MAKIKLQDSARRKGGAKKDESIIRFAPAVTYIWLLVVLVLFPIFTRNQYSDILTSKYKLLLAADIALIVFMLIWFLGTGRDAAYFRRLKNYADPQTGRWFVSWARVVLDPLDYCMIAFLIFAIISTAVSGPYFRAALTGAEGRRHGLILLGLYVITYFIVSRGMEFKTRIFTFFLIASMYVSFIAITDYFKLDLLHFKQGIAEENYAIFTSTIGNINTYTSFASIPLAAAGILFMLNTEKLWKTILFYAAFALALVSIIVASSDNGYLTFLAFYAFAPLAAFLTYKGIRRYVILLASFFSAVLLVQYWNVRYEGMVVTPSGVISALGRMGFIRELTIILWLLAAALCVYDLVIKKRDAAMPAGKVFRNIWAVLLGAGLIGLTVIVIGANKENADIPGFLEPFRSYIVFDDSWGTNRMFVWKALMKIRSGLPFINKLFGTGPETTGMYLDRMYDEIAAFTHQVYDSPHNELLQQFFCLGPFGFLSYIGIYVSVIVLAIKNHAKKYYPYMMAIAFVCICHLSECIVNIMVPIDVAVVFALIAVAGGLFRAKEE